MNLSATHRGMAFMVLSALVFMMMNGVTRHLSDDLHPFEVGFFRSLFGLMFFLPLLVRQRFLPLRTRRVGLHLLRGGVHAASMLMFFLALKHTPLAKLAALFFVTPLFGTVLAILILKETIRLRRVSALAIGFTGMLIIVQPGTDALDFGAMLVLGAAVFASFAVVLIKRLTTTESSVTMTIYSGLVTTPVAFIAAVPVWHTPTAEQLAWMVIIGCLGSIGQLSMVRALALAEATVVLPLDFTKLIWSALIGYFFFAEVPGVATWIGGAMIFTATIYIAHRERQIRGFDSLHRPPINFRHP